MFNVQNKWPVGSHDSFLNMIVDTLHSDVLMKLTGDSFRAFYSEFNIYANIAIAITVECLS